MENYVKVVLYAYPFLQNVGRDYEEHIQNKAILSYRSNKTAEEVALYLAEEIIRQRELVALKNLIDGVLDKLSTVEKLLVQIRYFGKERKMKKCLQPVKEGGYENWSESKYFRRQNRLTEKVQAMLLSAGLTKEVFEKKFAQDDIFKEAIKILKRRERKVCDNERSWLRFERKKVNLPLRKVDGEAVLLSATQG